MDKLALKPKLIGGIGIGGHLGILLVAAIEGYFEMKLDSQVVISISAITGFSVGWWIKE